MSKLHPLLQPLAPTADDPFDAIKAAHLLNRAGFGGTPEEIEHVMALGPIKAVDELLDFPEAGADEQSQTDVPDLSSIDGYPKSFRDLRQMYVGKSAEERKQLQQKFQMANREAMLATIGWWLKRMTFGPHPLQEKLTLFWHGHFTTSAKEEKAASPMWNQNELLRRFAAGNFRDYVRQVSRDPAMLDYLNNSQNRKAKPNENYARELMELFTLGIGNYSETDIKESARAFTGWAHDGDDFVFRKFDHDEGQKTFMGRKGNFGGDEVIDIILMNPACAPYIGQKLWTFFAYEDPEPLLVQGLGNIFRESKFELRPLIRTMLQSRAFYSERAIATQIKSPVQLVCGTVRLLGLKSPDPRFVFGALQQMGQVPLMPPNVKGWPGGRMWINTSTLFVRYNTAVMLAGGGGNIVAASGRKAGAKILKGFKPAGDAGEYDAKSATSAELTVDEWIARLIQRPIAAEKRQTLLDALGSKPDNADAVKKMIQLIVSMPEYQLC
ncbi:MAG: DUF1800 domain-containing protein [Anaerolineae bacterium]|nr:DUF1800 domain-containing protein [Phycisphaerae bacterium]